MTDTNSTHSLGVQLLAAATRHAMTALGTLALGAGAITTDQQSQFVAIGTGVVLWVAGLAWSYIQKKRAKS